MNVFPASAIAVKLVIRHQRALVAVYRYSLVVKQLPQSVWQSDRATFDLASGLSSQLH